MGPGDQGGVGIVKGRKNLKGWSYSTYEKGF
jgi:hypothetical protein